MIIQNSTLQSSASRQYYFTRSIYKERSERDNATGETVMEAANKVTHVNVTTASSNGTAQKLLPPSYETTCYETTGTVVTADGREFSFNISLEMSRFFTAMASSTTEVSFSALLSAMASMLCSSMTMMVTAGLTRQMLSLTISVFGLWMSMVTLLLLGSEKPR